MLVPYPDISTIRKLDHIIHIALLTPPLTLLPHSSHIIPPSTPHVCVRTCMCACVCQLISNAYIVAWV